MRDGEAGHDRRSDAPPRLVFRDSWESYGGNLTLLALGRQPDRWAAGLAIAAEGDLVASFHETGDALRNALMTFERMYAFADRVRVGGGRVDQPAGT